MNNKHTCLLTVLLLVTLLTSCTSTPPSAASAKPCEKLSSGVGKCPFLQLTPMSTIWTGFGNPNQNYSNLYTRVLINSLSTRTAGSSGDGTIGATGASGTKPVPGATAAPCTAAAPGTAATPGTAAIAANPNCSEPLPTPDDSTQLYDYHDRNPFLRAIWGIHTSLNLTAYVSVGAFQATVPLVTIDHTSNHSDGEKFVRIVAHTAQNFPLLLLKGDGSNAMATVHFVVKGTDSTQSSAAAAAIQAAQGVATVLAPESAVLTTLSSPANKEKAAALDKAINSVLSRQLDEEQWLDNDVRRWGAGAKVTFSIPPSGNESAWGDSPHFQKLGSWVVKFESPRPSVFSDIQICMDKTVDDYCRATVRDAADRAQKEADSRPQQVLNFSLVNGSQSLGTVSAYLKQQSWWDTSLKTFNALKDNENPKGSSISDFCRSIKQSIVAVGLNTIDAGIVTHAVSDGMTLPARVTAAMKSLTIGKDCQYAEVVD